MNQQSVAVNAECLKMPFSVPAVATCTSEPIGIRGSRDVARERRSRGMDDTTLPRIAASEAACTLTCDAKSA